MDSRKKGKYVGLLGALLLHVGVVALLLWITVRTTVPQEGTGLAVAMGTVDHAWGTENPKGLVDVDVLEPETTPEIPSETDEQPELITQEQEETVAVPKQKKPTPKPVTKKPEKTEKTAAEKEAEAKKLEAERRERERKAAAEAAANRVAGAFGKGAGMNKGTSAGGSGLEGSVSGNSSEGSTSGTGVGGSYDLGGRSLQGSLPVPRYTIQEEGRVVVAILVNPAGQVIKADIHRNTNTVNATLRKAALEAARKARFNVVGGVDNQAGTITYDFRLR